MTLLETFEMLKPALGQGLLIENKNQLQFIHDKVQEAALAAIPKERRRRSTGRSANHLLAAVPEGAEFEKLDNLFTIVSHLNLGREENPDADTAYLLSDSTTTPATRHWTPWPRKRPTNTSTSAGRLLPGDCWEDDHYERTFRIYQKAAKTELMCGNYGNSETLLNELLDHAKTDLDKAECLAEQTTSLSSIGNFIKAIETANRGLAYFGKAIPDDPDEADRTTASVDGRDRLQEYRRLGDDPEHALHHGPEEQDRACLLQRAHPRPVHVRPRAAALPLGRAVDPALPGGRHG